MLIRRQWQKAQDLCSSHWRTKCLIPTFAGTGALVGQVVASKGGMFPGEVTGFTVTGLLLGTIIGVVMTVIDPLRGPNALSFTEREPNPPKNREIDGFDERTYPNPSFREWTQELKRREMLSRRAHLTAEKRGIKPRLG